MFDKLGYVNSLETNLPSTEEHEYLTDSLMSSEI